MGFLHKRLIKLAGIKGGMFSFNAYRDRRGAIVAWYFFPVLVIDEKELTSFWYCKDLMVSYKAREYRGWFGCIGALHAPEAYNSQKLIIQRQKQPRHFVGGNKVPKMVLSKSQSEVGRRWSRNSIPPRWSEQKGMPNGLPSPSLKPCTWSKEGKAYGVTGLIHIWIRRSNIWDNKVSKRIYWRYPRMGSLSHLPQNSKLMNELNYSDFWDRVNAEPLFH